MNSNDPTPPVLIVDDNEDDVFLLRHALEAAGLKQRCLVFEDGGEVLIYLKGLCAMARSGGSIIPAVLFTDLRMPRIGGFEVLEWVKEQPKLRRMACVVISTSELEEDRERAVDCGAYAYLVKHPGAAELKALLHRLATEHAPGRLILHVA